MTPRRRLLRLINWFALLNAALLALVGLRYLWYYSPLEPVVGWSYAVIAFLGHMSALAYIPLLLLVPLLLLAPQSRVFVALYFFVGVAVDAMLAGWVWKRTARPTPRLGWYLALGLGCCVLASHLAHAWSESHYYAPVTAFTRYL